MTEPGGQLASGAVGVVHPDSKCRICGSPLYSTDHYNFEITYHCSSGEARFWDFDRGTIEQDKAKLHWDQSREEIYLNKQ